MLLSILVTFSVLVIVIGLTTAKLNAKTPCDHNWEETGDGNIKCTRCLRTIHQTSGANYTENSPEPASDPIYANQKDHGAINLSSTVIGEA